MALPKFTQEHTDKPLADRYVNMSNALARSAHGLTLGEKRVVAIGLAKTDSLPVSALHKAAVSGWAIRVSAAEYAENFCVDANTAYEALKSASDNLTDRKVRIFEKTKKGLKEQTINWCARSIYHHGEGWIEIHFTQFVAPHILALRGQFISYKLQSTKALRSIYSWRLMECLTTWKTTGLWVVEIGDFMDMMDVPDSYRKNFQAIRDRIIAPAIKELKSKNGTDIEWTDKRVGRKVISLEFRFEIGKQGVLDIE